MKKLSDHRKEKIVEFCKTHPKKDAVQVFRVSIGTVWKLTKGINYKKINHAEL